MTIDAILDSRLGSCWRAKSRLSTTCLPRARNIFDWLKFWICKISQSKDEYRWRTCQFQSISCGGAASSSFTLPRFSSCCLRVVCSCISSPFQGWIKTLQTKPIMKCLVLSVAVVVLALMVAYSSATTTAVAPSTTNTAAASQAGSVAATSTPEAATASVTQQPTSETTAKPTSSGLNVVPSVLVLAVVLLFAAFK